MADISVDPFTWSSTAGSNSPSGSTVIGSGLDDNLRAIQAGVKMSLDALGSVAGTNTITATAVGLTAYASGQSFEFTPAVTNTGATTINVTSLGAKNIFFGGAACSGGELVAGVPARIKYDGTQFNIIGPVIGTRLINSLGSDVLLNNTGSYFDGPTVAQGTAGTWFVSGTVTLIDTGIQAQIQCKLWDGTTTIASASGVIPALNNPMTMSLSGYITSPTGNLRISANDSSATTGKILFNKSGSTKDSTITAIRVG